MRAVTVQHSKLELVELADPRPAAGQVVLDVLGCGICGSDLHARQHADAEADALRAVGYDGFMRSDQQVVLGHEFVGRVARYGPTVGLAGVGAAFEALAAPGRHAKIIIEPASSAEAPS
jgi:threonine dehydrogenase-like Zn-dependent dehydrogenase